MLVLVLKFHLPAKSGDLAQCGDVLAMGARAVGMRIPRLSDLVSPWSAVYADLAAEL